MNRMPPIGTELTTFGTELTTFVVIGFSYICRCKFSYYAISATFGIGYGLINAC